MIDALTFKTEAEAEAAVLALKSKGFRQAGWVYSKILCCYLVPL